MNGPSVTARNENSSSSNDLLFLNYWRKITPISNYYQTMYYRMQLNRSEMLQPDIIQVADLITAQGRSENHEHLGTTVSNTSQQIHNAKSAVSASEPKSDTDVKGRSENQAQNSFDFSMKKHRRITASSDELHSSIASTDTTSSSTLNLTRYLERLISGDNHSSDSRTKTDSTMIDENTLRYLLREQRKAYKKMLDRERVKREALEDFIVKINSPKLSLNSNPFRGRNRYVKMPSHAEHKHGSLSKDIEISDSPYADNSSASSSSSFRMRAISSEKSFANSLDRPKRQQWVRKRSSSLSTPEERRISLDTVPAPTIGTCNLDDHETILTAQGSRCQPSPSINDHPNGFSENLREQEGKHSSSGRRGSRRKLFDKTVKNDKTCNLNNMSRSEANGFARVESPNLTCAHSVQFVGSKAFSKEVPIPSYIRAKVLDFINDSQSSQCFKPVISKEQQDSRDFSLNSTIGSSRSSRSTQVTKLSGSGTHLPIGRLNINELLPKTERRSKKAECRNAVSYFLPLYQEDNKENSSTGFQKEVNRQEKKKLLLQRCEARIQKISYTSNLRLVLEQQSRDVAAQVLVGRLSIKDATTVLESLPDPPDAFPKREIFNASKKKFEMLPEVLQRRRKLIQEFELCTNRIRAKLFVQKQLRRTLSSSLQHT